MIVEEETVTNGAASAGLTVMRASVLFTAAPALSVTPRMKLQVPTGVLESVVKV